MTLNTDETGLELLKHYEPILWTCQNCFCGLCVEGCPAYRESGNETVSARGLAQIGLALLSGELSIFELQDDLVYACTGCGWCETVCSMNTSIYIKSHGNRQTKVSGATMAEKFRSMKIADSGKLPMEIRNALTSISRYGNPYGLGEEIKDTWIADHRSHPGNSDILFYVGATVPYDHHSKAMAEAIIRILRKCHIDFSMLGSKERESGAFSLMLGEEWLFAEMEEHNKRMFDQYHINTIICLSPHDYDSFCHNYSGISHIDVRHYTQVIDEMIESGEIKPNKDINRKVVYHDPCYLGRQNGIYEEPRRILKSIPGLELVETERSRENAFCCGGGGAGLFFDHPNIHMDRTRAMEIQMANPDCVAVACPNCYQMLDGAMKSLSYDIEVRDIAQLLLDSL